MNKPINFLMLFLIILVIFSAGCSENVPKQEDYEKCTSVCASVLGDDFVTMELCRQDCEKRFLEE